MKMHELISTNPYLKSFGSHMTCGMVKDRLKESFCKALAVGSNGKLIRPDRIFYFSSLPVLLAEVSRYIDITDPDELSQWLVHNADIGDINTLWVSLELMS